MSAQTSGGQRSGALAVFLVGFVCLMLELIQVRMFSFFLGSVSNFLAIPVALLGLALGSLYCHFIYRGSASRLITAASNLIFPVLVLTFVTFFAVADAFFSKIHMAEAHPYEDAARLITYAGLFIPAYFLFGVLFGTFFKEGAAQIGKLYFYDLSGAALGCLLTPVLITYTDLPVVILTLLLASLLLPLLFRWRFRALVVGAMAVVYVAVAGAATGGELFRAHPRAKTLASTLFRNARKANVEEVAVRWNHVARISLLRNQVDGDPLKSRFTIVQDDGQSNVNVRSFRESNDVEPPIERYMQHSIPWVLDREPERILVLFAGVGQDMISFDQLSLGRAQITGIEINEGVVEMVHHPAIRHYNLPAFLARDNIDLVVAEGRDFLNTTDEKYDLIFAATSGAVQTNRTGHTRKFLDTYEAMAAYLDHLAPDGLIVFCNQTVKNKIRSLRRLFVERGLADPSLAMFVFGNRSAKSVESMVVDPRGLTPKDVDRLARWVKKQARPGRKAVLYAPYRVGKEPYESLVAGTNTEIRLLTDDRPFAQGVKLGEFELAPGNKRLNNRWYAANWIKIFTVLLFAVVTLLVFAAVRFLGRKSGRIPAPWLAFFFLSGLAYMGVEIGLIARTELFLGNPLYAVAINLAVFLMSNSLGAYLQDRYRVMRGLKTMALYTMSAVAWALVAMWLANSYLLALPLALKVLGVGVAVLPVGTCLGMYYPYGVSQLVDRGLAATVPATYAASTLSSVLGSAVAMTAITNIGFSAVILIGTCSYLAAALVSVVAVRPAR